MGNFVVGHLDFPKKRLCNFSTNTWLIIVIIIISIFLFSFSDFLFLLLFALCFNIFSLTVNFSYYSDQRPTLCESTSWYILFHRAKNIRIHELVTDANLNVFQTTGFPSTVASSAKTELSRKRMRTMVQLQCLFVLTLLRAWLILSDFNRKYFFSGINFNGSSCFKGD